MSHIAHVDDVTDSEVITMKFANYFQSNCKPFNNARSAGLKLQYGSPAIEAQQFDVELIGSLISKMNNGKAAGLDGLSCEHIKFSHLIVVSILSKLFNMFIKKAPFPLVSGPVTQYRFRNAMLNLAYRSMTLEVFP